MNNFHYHQDPLYSAAARILEGASEVQAMVKDFAVGDNTNFGKVLEIGADSITFKAKDLPKTRITFNQRKMGSSEFLLTKLIKLKEETEASEDSLDEGTLGRVHKTRFYPPLKKPEDLVAELQTIIDAPEGKLWDVTSVSLRVSHEDIFDRFPKIYDYVEDMWAAIMTPDGARKTKEIAKKAIEAVHKYYPIKEETEASEETLGEASMDSLSLSDLWNKHREYTYAADQGWGGGYGSAKGGKAAAEAIYKFVATKYDKKTAEDMQDASDNYLGYQEYVGGAEAKSAKADEEKLRKKYGIKEETESSEESLEEAYKPLRKSKDLVAELQSIIDAPDAKLWDVTSVSIRLSHDDIFDRFPKIYPYVKDMWAAIMTPDGARKTKEIAKHAIEAVHKHYPIKEGVESDETETLDEESDLSTLRQRLDKHSEAAIAANREGDDEKVKYHQTQMNKIKERMANMVRNEEVETLDEEINWLGGYLATSEKSQFGSYYLPKIIDKKTKGLVYQSTVKYNTPQEAKDHAEDYLKQKSKGIKNPKVPRVGTYKEETEEEVTEAVDPATKRRKQLDMARVNAGAMSRDDYNKKYKLGKYRPAGSKPSGPGGLYKNLVKEVLDPEDDASVWIDDFVKSDDPRFEGKSKEERIKMALGAWYAAQKKESVEQSTESLEEATMNAAEKKMAQEIHKVFKDGEQVSQAYAMRIRDMRKQLIKKFGNNWRQKAGITEEGAESLEEVVALPSVKKVIDMVDAMSPKEYSNFLHALADNAFGIAVSTKRVKPNGPSNSDAWEDVADGIRDAAKAYDARPVKMSEGVEELEEAAIYPLTKKALNATFELDSDEFEEFLKELTMYFNKTGDKTGYNEYFQVGEHLEKAYKIWKGRDPDVGLDYGI